MRKRCMHIDQRHPRLHAHTTAHLTNRLTHARVPDAVGRIHQPAPPRLDRVPVAPAVNCVREHLGNRGCVRERLVGHDDFRSKARRHGRLESAQEAFDLARLAAAGEHEHERHKTASPIGNANCGEAESIRAYLGSSSSEKQVRKKLRQY